MQLFKPVGGKINALTHCGCVSKYDRLKTKPHQVYEFKPNVINFILTWL